MSLNLTEVASSFYEFVADGDRDALRELVTTSFAENASLARPESLPGGGVLDGRERIIRFMEKAAGKAPLEVRRIEVNGLGTEAFAHVDIVIGGNSASALEWWSAIDGEVVSVKAFYWDTAAMLAAG